MSALRPPANGLVRPGNVASGNSPAIATEMPKLVGLGRSAKSYFGPLAPQAEQVEEKPIPLMLKGAGSSAPIVLLGIYLFLLSSQANQFLVAYAHIALPLVAAAFYIVGMSYLVGGGTTRFISSPFMVPWTAMFMWCVVTAFTGIYPGRSIPFILKDYGLRIHLLPFFICGICETFEHVRKAMVGAALGLGVVFFFCFYSGTVENGRFFIPDTSLANGNDLAMHIILFSSLAVALLVGGKGPQLVFKAGLPVGLFYVLKTGSRANMLTVILIMAIGFFLLPAKQKIMMVMLAIVVPVVIVPFLPNETRSRLGSFFSPSEDAADAQQAELNRYAVDSTNARLDLQLNAIKLTGENFLLGIGAQNFMDAVDEMTKKHGGTKSGWQVAHNSYLQISAETGIPGLIFYAWNIILCIAMNVRAVKRYRVSKDPKTTNTLFLISFGLLAASCVYAFGILFSSMPFDFHLAMLIGLTASMDFATQKAIGPKAVRPVAGYGTRQKLQPLPAGAMARSGFPGGT